MKKIIATLLIMTMLMTMSVFALSKEAGGIKLEVVPGETIKAQIGMKPDNYPEESKATIEVLDISVGTVLGNGTTLTQPMANPIAQYFEGPEEIDFTRDFYNKGVQSGNLVRFNVSFKFPNDINVTKLAEDCKGFMPRVTEERDPETGQKIIELLPTSICKISAFPSEDAGTLEGSGILVRSGVDYRIEILQGAPQEETSSLSNPAIIAVLVGGLAIGGYLLSTKGKKN